MMQMEIEVIHIFRKANQLADYIVNKTFTQDNKIHYFQFYQLPTTARGILNMDKHQVPAIRVRARLINGGETYTSV